MQNTIESESQQERILARRERIEVRKEQKSQTKSQSKKEKFNEENRNFNLVHKEPTISANTATGITEQNETCLEEFIAQGKSILSDVKVASTNHEANRRKMQEKQQLEMLERLEMEAKREAIKFEEIANKWRQHDQKTDENNSTSQTDPSNLYELLNEQNNSCKKVISEKNKLINLLKEVARTAEDRYVKDLKRENDDIELISKRMENHVKEMSMNFQNSLNKIQEALINDRNKTLSSAVDKSENSWKARALREIEMVYLRLEETDHFMTELDDIRERGSEEYAIMKNKLERDVMTHEQQLQQMKAIYQLNQEKLQYNHEILRNREDENNIIKAQQKRRITKLQDSLNSQRQKLVKQEQQQKNEAAQLSDDYDRIVTQTKELGSFLGIK